MSWSLSPIEKGRWGRSRSCGKCGRDVHYYQRIWRTQMGKIIPPPQMCVKVSEIGPENEWNSSVHKGTVVFPSSFNKTEVVLDWLPEFKNKRTVWSNWSQEGVGTVPNKDGSPSSKMLGDLGGSPLSTLSDGHSGPCLNMSSIEHFCKLFQTSISPTLIWETTSAQKITI